MHSPTDGHWSLVKRIVRYLLSKELSGISKVRHLMVCTSLGVLLFPYMVLQMLTELVVLMIENPPVATWYISTEHLFLGSLQNNEQWLVHWLKQNIRFLRMVLLRSYEFGLCCQIFIFLLILWLSFGVIIWLLPTCLSILSFMLALNMLKSIITLFVIELLKRKLRFGSSPRRINLLMFLPNLFLTHPSLIFGPSFMWNFLLQLEGAYYEMFIIMYIYIYLVFTLYKILIMCSTLHV